MKTKIFTGSTPYEIGEKLQLWLDKNVTIKIVAMSSSVYKDVHYLTIVYETVTFGWTVK